MRVDRTFLTLLLFVSNYVCAFPGQGNAQIVMPPIEVSPQGDMSAFSTPMAYFNGCLVLAHVVSPDAQTRPNYLRTTVRVGCPDASGSWLWKSSTLDRATLFDPYHTQPSVAVDRVGFIHVVYNMHHFPWQYSVSRSPMNVDSFEFAGEEFTFDAREMARVQNKTHFPSIGAARIPGSQITYPSFFKNRNGDLFVSYRYALKPARPWGERAYAYGLAGYDVSRRIWIQHGAEIELTVGDALEANKKSGIKTSPFVFDSHYIPYVMKFGFDKDNGLHAIWTWWDAGSGRTGEYTISPSYRYVADVSAPMSLVDFSSSEKIPGWSDETVFNTAKDMVVKENGDVLAILEPRGAVRKIVRREFSSGRWSAAESAPNSASKILVTSSGEEWVFAAGPTLFVRKEGGGWSRPLKLSEGWCQPYPIYVDRENAFYIHAKKCDDFGKAIVIKYFVE